MAGRWIERNTTSGTISKVGCLARRSRPRGNNVTKAGVPYHNTYCDVFRVSGGRLKELTEYMDTELVTAVLGDPPK